MGCKSAAKFNLDKKTIALSSSLSSLFFLKCKKVIQEQGEERGGECDLDDGEEGEEGNNATNNQVILFERSFPLRDNSGMSIKVDNSVVR